MRKFFWILLSIGIISCGKEESIVDSPKPTPVTPVEEIEKPSMDLSKYQEGRLQLKAEPKENPLENANQLILSVLPDEESVKGTLQLFDKNERGDWIPQGKTYASGIGKNGLAWGLGELPEEMLGGTFKKEGDGCAPAGIFTLGTAFGYWDGEKRGFDYPYVQSLSDARCVDDISSKYYNQVLRERDAEKDWNSAEEMVRKDDLYKWGLVVHHNEENKAGAGSCIFMHVWRGEGKGTAGCTVQEESNMHAMLKWLKQDKNPMLVQITKDRYPAFQEWFGLPTL